MTSNISDRDAWIKKRIEAKKNFPRLTIARKLAVSTDKGLVDAFRRKGDAALVFPSQKQWLFVKYVMDGYTQEEAARKAGYLLVAYGRKRQLRSISDAKGVQFLFELILTDYLRKREISASALLDKALGLYDRCETVQEQLQVLKFIKDLMPKKAFQCPESKCPYQK